VGVAEEACPAETGTRIAVFRSGALRGLRGVQLVVLVVDGVEILVR
jgi:hypothetical protein